MFRAYPTAAHWAEGEPTSGVNVIVGVSDRVRSLRVGGKPVATGIVPLGDAWACTNPSLGRGISMAMMHIAATVPAMAEHLDDPKHLLDVWEYGTEKEMSPWHEATRQLDRAHTRRMDALRSGQSLSPEEVANGQAFAAAQLTDPDIFRAAMEMASCFALPEEVMNRPYVQEALADPPDLDDIALPPVPSRQELEELLGA